MLFEIKRRFSGEVVFKLETESFRLCVEAAIKSEADLSRAYLYDADLSGADLSGANLSGADLSRAYLYDADLSGAYLYDADLSGACLSDADLSGAYLSGACLSGANLYGAYLYDADLSGADLSGANLSGACLYDADLSGADLSRANLSRANLSRANLSGARNMIKTMGVETGNYYWKRFNEGLVNNNYQFKVGINRLRDGEVFADDERQVCSSPGFHFASRSWCAVNYGDRPLEAKIRIPEDAKINEPWATDGKASADTIEIIQVFDVATGTDVTEQYR